ncbi:MATE family efflux transporter [Alysiella crassa]|uniref:Multidrug-efflux transporter n=1 Tax=Alysiella crassa TaxID=153491 RepID=A0A376BM35_9NEIS|nr:MATE family efflux transporter [Alysiella crassa]UOP07110.1 MATE family efflux transporter [Alysiella crassa]SSY70740.1 Na(+)/drug antiporter [Alysiella crassa]
MQLFQLHQHPLATFQHESKHLIALALPIMLAQMAAVGVGVVDTAMAGAAGKDDLTAVALGSAVFNTLFITFLGVMAALNPIISQLHGANQTEQVGETGRQGLWFGGSMGIMGMLLMFASIAPTQNYLNMADNVETMLGDYLFYTALGMPAAMLHRALYAYASSLNRPKPIMWVSWAALLLNIPLNYIFVYGKLGLPEMGGAGCGLATALVFWFNAIALGLYILKNRYFQVFGLTKKFSPPNWTAQKQMWALGLPIGFSYFLEASLFTCIVWLIANLGEDFVAAQQVVISITSITYMIPQAIGSAATVRIGYALGQRDMAMAQYRSGVSLACGLVLAVITLIVLILLRYPLVQVYTQDLDVIAIAVSIIWCAALFQLFDYTQCIASYALRGYKVTRIPMIIHGIAFWGMGLLPGYILAYPFGLGIYGFWIALIVSLAAAAVALVYYLQKISANHLKTYLIDT